MAKQTTTRPKVAKDLAKDLNLTPFRIRQLLRTTYGNVKGKRWRWTTQAAYDKVLNALRKQTKKGKKS